MSWVNVMTLPGVTYQIEYKQFSGAWGDDAFGAPIVESGGHFTVSGVSLYGAWSSFRIFVQIPGQAAPLAVRSVVTTAETSIYGDYFYSKGDSTLPDPGRLFLGGATSGQSTGTLLDLDLPFALYEAGYDFGTLTIDFTIEVEETPPFWTDLVHSFEAV